MHEKWCLFWGHTVLDWAFCTNLDQSKKLAFWIRFEAQGFFCMQNDAFLKTYFPRLDNLYKFESIGTLLFLPNIFKTLLLTLFKLPRQIFVFIQIYFVAKNIHTGWINNTFLPIIVRLRVNMSSHEGCQTKLLVSK